MKPHFTIGDAADPLVLRWYLLPKNPIFNVYLHKICKSDDHRAPHTHPWLFNISVILRGCYVEVLRPRRRYNRLRLPGRLVFRWGSASHRLILYSPCWTLFITGPRVRDWGFLCPQGFVDWRDFTANSPGQSLVGRGCDQ